MSLFNSYQNFAINTIEENLHIAKYCIDTPKETNTNSCYGMPALILLSSVIDTIGTFYKKDKNGKIVFNKTSMNKREQAKVHFETFYDIFINNTKDEKKLFCEKFYHLGRCKATHNNVLGLNFRITIDKNLGSSACCIWENNNITYVQLSRLYKLVYNAYELVNNASNGIPTPLGVPQETTGITSQRVVTYQK